MSTLIGSLIEAIGDRLASDLPGYSIVYGLPVAGGDYIGASTPSIRVHYRQERGVFAGSQLGGPVRVSPEIVVSLQRPYYSDASTLADQQSSMELSADLRDSVAALVMDHVTGVSVIAAFAGQALWITDYTMTDSVLDGLTETITCQFSFEFSRPYGGR